MFRYQTILLIILFIHASTATTCSSEKRLKCDEACVARATDVVEYQYSKLSWSNILYQTVELVESEVTQNRQCRIYAVKRIRIQELIVALELAFVGHSIWSGAFGISAIAHPTSWYAKAPEGAWQILKIAAKRCAESLSCVAKFAATGLVINDILAAPEKSPDSFLYIPVVNHTYYIDCECY